MDVEEIREGVLAILKELHEVLILKQKIKW